MMTLDQCLLASCDAEYPRLCKVQRVGDSKNTVLAECKKVGMELNTTGRIITRCAPETCLCPKSGRTLSAITGSSFRRKLYWLTAHSDSASGCIMLYQMGTVYCNLWLPR